MGCIAMRLSLYVLVTTRGRCVYIRAYIFLRASGLRARSDAETVQRIHLAIAEVTTFPLPEIKKYCLFYNNHN